MPLTASPFVPMGTMAIEDELPPTNQSTAPPATSAPPPMKRALAMAPLRMAAWSRSKSEACVAEPVMSASLMAARSEL